VVELSFKAAVVMAENQIFLASANLLVMVMVVMVVTVASKL